MTSRASRNLWAGAWQMRLVGVLTFLPPVAAQGSERATIDLAGAMVVTTEDRVGSPAVRLLLEEVERRTLIRWPVGAGKPRGGRPAILVGTEAGLHAAGAAVGFPAMPDGEPASRPESYRIHLATDGGRPVVWVLGADERGVLFGVGRLLRAMHLTRDRVAIPGDLSVTAAPRYPVRGHQLGYRPKTNSYDGWDAATWERYIRDLIVFGANAIELIPPRSDDEPDSTHFPLPQIEMLTVMSGLARQYGLDVWIWYPALDADYDDPATLERAVEEWGAVFRAMPRLDALFVPGGDPGRTPPKPLFRLLERQAANLRKYHPKATMWFSPQGFDRAAFEEILALLRAEPEWLAGVVFGPQVRMDLPALRDAVPRKYPIRFYPDITHSRTCQYPVPDWDRAFALTEAREVINPRPLDQAAILRRLGPYTNGFITYSEGCNDDVNKAVWSALGWEPDANVTEILREYARYYIDAELADPLAQGILSLERNWRGPAATNVGIEVTLAQFREMERTASPQVKANWRFQQLLYRAYYDAYVRRRVIREAALEQEALEVLQLAPRLGARAAMDRAEAILLRALTEPTAPELRARIGELAEALFQSIRMQLSVEKYQAVALGRGTSQDTLDAPLNDRVWIIQSFEAIRGIPQERERLERISALVERRSPGPGGFYDDLGNVAAQPHLVRGPGFEEDPAARGSVLMHFDDGGGGPIAWRDQTLVLYEQPLRMRYEGLDRNARYRVRVVYSLGPIRLAAKDGPEIHPPIDRRYEPLEFPIPREATEQGRLELEFTGQPGRGGNGRTCAVTEVWLIRDDAAEP